MGEGKSLTLATGLAVEQGHLFTLRLMSDLRSKPSLPERPK
jgi:hypothetical protein